MMVKVKGALRVNVYRVLCEAVEGGVEHGWNRARKHTARPSPATVKEAILDAVMIELCERFSWDDPAVPA